MTGEHERAPLLLDDEETRHFPASSKTTAKGIVAVAAAVTLLTLGIAGVRRVSTGNVRQRHV